MTRARITDLLEQSRSANLFGVPTGFGRRERALLLEVGARLRTLRRLRRAITRDGQLPWFHFPSQFAEVFTARGGFDLVIGNPPWVRAEALEPAIREQLSQRYRWWAARSGRGYAHQADLAVAFLERGLELTAPSGTLAFLVPAKLATAGYATIARATLAARTTVRVVEDLTGDPRASFEAATYPLALVATKEAAPPAHRVRTALDGEARPTVLQARLSGAPWILAGDRLADALEHLAGEHPRLGDRLVPHLGVKTGCNQVFLDPPATVEPELLWWAIRGRDVGAFAAAPRCRLLWTHGAGGEPLERLPPRAAAYLAGHRDLLRKRRDFDRGPEWTVFRVRPALAPHRVVWADLAPRLEAVALTGCCAERLVPLNTCYVAPVVDEATAHRLAAWLNCTWIRAAAAAWADPASSGFRRFNARVASALPLPDAVLRDDALLALGRAGRAGILRQDDLDDACNRWLNLPPAHQQALAARVPSDRRRRR